MKHETMVNGTVLRITGGRTNVKGTNYDIIGGKTMVDGTVQDITIGEYTIVYEGGGMINIEAANYSDYHTGAATVTVEGPFTVAFNVGGHDMQARLHLPDVLGEITNTAYESLGEYQFNQSIRIVTDWTGDTRVYTVTYL